MGVVTVDDLQGKAVQGGVAVRPTRARARLHLIHPHRWPPHAGGERSPHTGFGKGLWFHLPRKPVSPLMSGFACEVSGFGVAAWPCGIAVCRGSAVPGGAKPRAAVVCPCRELGFAPAVLLACGGCYAYSPGREQVPSGAVLLPMPRTCRRGEVPPVAPGDHGVRGRAGGL